MLDDGFSWQGTYYRSLSAVARKITGTAWSGPLFFGLKQNRPATRSVTQHFFHRIGDELGMGAEFDELAIAERRALAALIRSSRATLADLGKGK